MNQAADARLSGQFVIEIYGFFGLQDMDFDAALVQQLQRFRAGAQPLVVAARKHDDFGAVIQKFLDIRRLDARFMVRAGLPPVPRPRAAGKQFCVAESPAAGDLHLAPFEPYYSRRCSVGPWHGPDLAR